jgi:uncharacterized protein YraI
MMIKKKLTTMTFIIVAITALLVTACGSPTPTPAPTQDVALIQTQSAQTVVANLTQSAPVPATPVPPPPGPTPNASLPVAVIPTPAAGEPAAIANYNTTINSGPGTNYVVYSVFLGSATAKVVGKNENGTWWAISVPVAPNGMGWVDAAWVTVSNAGSVPVVAAPPVPASVALVPPGPTDPQAATLANTYVRTGPGTNYPAYGIAPAGASAWVIGKSEDSQWWVVRLDPVKVGAGYGWVSVQYTQAQNVDTVQVIQTPPPAQAVPASPPAAGVPAGTATDYVNVRTGPGTNYPVLGVAGPGASAEITGKSADGAWWQIKVPTSFSADGFGWASAGYVITQNTDSVPVVAAPPAPAVPPAPPTSTVTGCLLESQNPADGTVFAAATSFDTTWVLKNTGSTNWDQSALSFVYKGAASNVWLHPGPDQYGLTSTVEPGWTYNFTVPMLSPSVPGTFGEMWQLTDGSQIVCQFYVYIEVK